MLSKVINAKVERLFPDALLPTQGHEGDAGYDIYVHRFHETDWQLTVYTGIAVQPDKGYYFDLVARSSTPKKGLILYNSVGIIDNTYTGEIIGKFYKTRDYRENTVVIGDRLLQLILRRQIPMVWSEVDKLDETVRGSGGFGST